MELIILFSAWLLFPLFLPQNTVNALSDFLGCFHLLFKLGVRLARGEGDGRATDHPRKVQVFAGSFFNRISSHFLFHVSLVPEIFPQFCQIFFFRGFKGHMLVEIGL